MRQALPGERVGHRNIPGARRRGAAKRGKRVGRRAVRVPVMDRHIQVGRARASARTAAPTAGPPATETAASATLSPLRKGVKRIARVVTRVVEKEERARAVQELAGDQRAAKGRAETLLEIVRLRCRSIQRVRRGIQRRRVETLKHGAANLIAAAASTEGT